MVDVEGERKAERTRRNTCDRVTYQTDKFLRTRNLNRSSSKTKNKILKIIPFVFDKVSRERKCIL